MKLLYLYVEKSERTLEDFSMNFSDSFHVEYKEGNLLIERKDPVVKVFPSAIEDLTVIVGKNGCGKTSILELLFENSDSDNSAIGNEGRYFLLYHLKDEGDTGYFYRIDIEAVCSGRIEKLKSTSKRWGGRKEYQICYSYSKKRILTEEDYHYIANRRLYGQILSANERLGSKSKINTDMLYHYSETKHSWYRDVPRNKKVNGYVRKLPMTTSPYSLLKFLSELIKSHKNSKGSTVFQSDPCGLSFSCNFEISGQIRRIAYNDNSQYSSKPILSLLLDYLVVITSSRYEEMPEIVNAINNQVKDFLYEHSMYKQNTDDYIRAVEVGIAKVLFSCMGLDPGTDSTRHIDSPFFIALVFAIILAIEGERYATFMDKCFQCSVLSNPNFNESQMRAWQTVYNTLDILDDNGVCKWQKHPENEYRWLLNQNNWFGITISLYDHIFVKDTKKGGKTVINDSILKLLFVMENLKKYHFRSYEDMLVKPRFQVSGLSSGELDYIELFSSIYSGLAEIYSSNPITRDLSECRYPDTCILILDEPDSTFHPEWSRKFIKTLTDMLSSEPFVFYPCRYQVIITTHSPIMLSDVPSHNIRCLDIVDGHTVVKETEYGLMSNINDIMISSFFVGKPFGTFAESYVNSLIERINDYGKKLKNSYIGKQDDAKDSVSLSEEELKAERNYLVSAIEIISEPYVRSVLTRQMEEEENKAPNLQKWMLEEKIRLLQKQLDKMNGDKKA